MSLIEAFMDFVGPWLLGACMLLTCGLIFIGLPWIAYDYWVAEKFELRKDEWSCSKDHQEMNVQHAYGDKGQIIASYPVYTTVCDQWSRR